MQRAEIGRWEFDIPDGWAPKDQGIGISYLESPDGTRGMYCKTVYPPEEKQTAQSASDYIQEAHERGFRADQQANWTVVASEGFPEGELYRSRLDLWDQGAKYLVQSHVLSLPGYAVHLTLHDYQCPEYPPPDGQFDAISRSLCLFAGAA